MDRFLLDGALRPFAIPTSLHDSLMARLDRLGPVAKEIEQIGAVIGREFGYDLIDVVAQKPAAELRGGLDCSLRPDCYSAAA